MIFQNLVETFSNNEWLETVFLLVSHSSEEFKKLCPLKEIKIVVGNSLMQSKIDNMTKLAGVSLIQEYTPCPSPRLFVKAIQTFKENVLENAQLASLKSMYFHHLRTIKEYQAFVLPTQQVEEFNQMTLNTEDTDIFFKMKMPFEKIFIDFNGVFKIGNFNIKGLFLQRENNKYFIKAITDVMLDTATKNINEITKIYTDLKEHGWGDFIKRDYLPDPFILSTKEDLEMLRNNATFGMFVNTLFATQAQLVLNTPFVVIDALKKETLVSIYDIQENKEAVNDDALQQMVTSALKKIVVGFCLYINSINVKVERLEGSALQTKKRVKQNKPIPEPYYICKLETREASKSSGEPLTKHGYQYDVRGHFSHYRNTYHGKPVTEFSRYNADTGAITIWVPPHRRGLNSDVYRPKIYSVNS